MHRYPVSARVMMGLTVLAAAATVGWNSRIVGFDTTYTVAFAALSVLGSVSLMFPIRSPRGQATYLVCNVFVFAAILMLPASWTDLMCVLMWIPNLIQRSRGTDRFFWVPPVVNAAQLVVVTQIVYWFLGLTSVAGPWTGAAILMAVMASFLFVVAQSLHVSVMVSLYRKEKWQSSDVLHMDSFISDEVQVLVGIVFAVIYHAQPAILPVMGLLVLIAYRLAKSIQEARQADLDPKTSLFNYHYLETRLPAAITAALARDEVLSIVFADIDHLREVNNAHGHQVGDAAIRHLARTLQACATPRSFACRFGGEEFVLVLPAQSKEQAIYLAESIRESAAAVRLQIGGQGSSAYTQYTVSCGVAACPVDAESFDELIKAADNALYAAKAGGRNQVCAANTTSDVYRSFSSEPPARALHEVPVPSVDPAVAVPETPRLVRDAIHVEMPLSARVFLVSVLSLAVAVSIASLSRPVRPAQAGGLVIMCFLSAIAQQLRVRIFVKDGAPRSMSVSMAVTMAAGVHFGMTAAIFVNLVSGVAQVIEMKKREPHKVAFNLAMSILAAAGGSVFLRTAAAATGFVSYEMASIAAIVLGSLLYYLLNVGLMVSFMSLLGGKNPVHLWRTGMMWMTPHYLFFAVSGGFLGHFQSVLGTTGTVVLAGLMLGTLKLFDQQVCDMHTSLQAKDQARLMLSQASQMERDSLSELIEAISAVIDARDSSTYGHSRQVAKYAIAIAEEYGEHDPERLESVRLGALLHDLGKIGTPEYVLYKPGRLTPEEYEIIKNHTLLGERILGEVSKLSDIGILVGQHHERWDGHGYPRALSGAEAELGARAIAIADSLDSMLSDRVYAKARTLAAALAEIERCSGTQFEPEMVSALSRVAERAPAGYFRNSNSLGDFGHLMVRPVLVATRPASDV